jgi:N-methylhydantoinase B/oxoprolinase/acetone carboxylase alpha subunit
VIASRRWRRVTRLHHSYSECVESQIRGHFLPGLVHGALAKVVPERILAQGADCLWNTQITGEKADGEPFTYVFFSGGGMGVRPESDGLSATAIPSGIRGVPAEVIESISPIVMHKRELRPDSEGAGRHRGGLGQEMERSSKP